MNLLKEIEIQGFKSVADKTTVVFDQGVTAVVGPNGSGKWDTVRPYETTATTSLPKIRYTKPLHRTRTIT